MAVLSESLHDLFDDRGELCGRLQEERANEKVSAAGKLEDARDADIGIDGALDESRAQDESIARLDAVVVDVKRHAGEREVTERRPQPVGIDDPLTVNRR